MTTYTYLTTLLEKGETLVSSREEVVSNVVTEERRPSVQVTPTPVTKVCCNYYMLKATLTFLKNRGNNCGDQG